MKMHYPHVPGRGLMTQTAYELRMEYLNLLVDHFNDEIKSEKIHLSEVQNNIESFIGTIEIPLGLIGPLLFNDKDAEPEWVHTALATTEGALVASMNRGAKAISQCGGFRAHTIHQKMLRTPMFTFSSMTEALIFDEWIENNFKKIKNITKLHSNHAELLEISSVVVGKIIHLKFIFTTSDASGQNMTTACTWNACLWIEENFEKQTKIEILHFVIEGNGASDKKVSYASMQNGRGTRVISECFLTNEIIEKTLRTNTDDMFRSFNHSTAISRLDGMIGNNINVANAIAGIFGSTGQDLASIHESSTAVLQMEQNKEGLYVSLILPNLVIGSVGGGTHLPVASGILKLMGCKGAGKTERFAKLIAGFALALELSTLAAIVSGQFARAHQKLGRNKPVKWLLESEVDEKFLKNNMPYFKQEIASVSFNEANKLDNGILTQLTGKVSKKLLGFIAADLHTPTGQVFPVLLKSKALGDEMLDGLHFMASNVSVELADLLLKYKDSLEYKNSHLKEIEIYEALYKIGFEKMPAFYGSVSNQKREMYLLLFERLLPKKMLLFNAEDTPDKWSAEIIQEVIDAIHSVHSAFVKKEQRKELVSIDVFDILKSTELYNFFIALNRKDYDYLDMDHRFEQMNEYVISWNLNGLKTKGTPTLLHNDFNPRNIAIRNNGQPCIYDWELATIGLPQRDVFEFLAFTLTKETLPNSLGVLLKYHYELVCDFNAEDYQWADYISDFKLAGQSFLVSRVNFYLAGSTLVNYSFIERVFETSFAILDHLDG